MQLNKDGSFTITATEADELRGCIAAGSLAMLTCIMTDNTMPDRVKESGLTVVKRTTEFLTMLRQTNVPETVQ